MVELKEKLKKVCDLKEKMIGCIESEIISKGIDSVDPGLAGEVIDMIKDLSDVEKNCWKAKYYETVVEAMKNGEARYSEFSGYNSNRFADGRFAPSGHGNMTRGYMPNMFIPEMEMDDHFGMMEVMGYGNGMSGNSRNSSNNDGRSNNSGSSGYTDPSYHKLGHSYGEYETARRHYTQTKSLSDKTEMDKRAMEHVDTAIDTFREIWDGADPSLRKRMKEEISSLVTEW